MDITNTIIPNNMLPTSGTLKTPFELPELRCRISGFVPVKDALSCSLVCKAWTADFMAIIWHTVDFRVHSRFTDLSPEVISKYGHYIRVILLAYSEKQVSLVTNAAVRDLKVLRIFKSRSTTQNTNIQEIIHRNIHSLCDLLVSLDSAISRDSSVVITAPTLVSSGIPLRMTATLTKLRLEKLQITHSDLVAALQVAPFLESLMLSVKAIDGRVIPSFKHTQLKTLMGNFQAVFSQDGSLSLLSYFPNLIRLCLWPESSQMSIPTAKIKADIAEYCPRLREFGIERLQETFILFCNQIIRNPTQITFDFDYISDKVIAAILQHQATLTKITIYVLENGYDFNTDKMFKASRSYDKWGHLLEQIPRSCSKLEELDLHLYEMKLDDVEDAGWVCMDLKILWIQIKGLDTKEKIMRAIELWRSGAREWRRTQAMESRGMKTTEVDKEKEKDSNKEAKELENIDTSIEARVARHLLKFKKLQQVWLGYQIWYLV
ncbi:hypothetical protein FBU30_007805 [Linnemannia zychae]|nr:hypothetical protein FBU30_007805 [Linnemannia zychae]